MKKIELKRTYKFIFIILCLLGCNASKEIEFNKYGVSFIIPEDWKVSTEGNSNGNVCIICDRKAMLASNNIVGINYYKDSSDLRKLILWEIRSYKTNMSILNPVFETISDFKFNKFKGYKINYTAKVSNIELVGRIQCFHVGNRNISISITENVKDTSENKVGINKIINSLNFSN